MKKAAPEEPAGLTKCGSNNKTTGGFLRARQIRNTDEERPAHTKVGSKETITGGISLLTFVTISFKIGQRHNRKLDQENKPLAVFSSGVNGEGLRPMSRWYNRRLVWSRRLGSNQRPAVYETAALPLSYVGKQVRLWLVSLQYARAGPSSHSTTSSERRRRASLVPGPHFSTRSEF